jgi:uncharacterized protein YndB with AHSA1/START domain
MKVDHQAPLVASKEITIAAPVQSVWQVLTDINHWPDWQADVTEARLEGALAAGTSFIWKARGLKISSILQVVEANHQVGWTGDSIGMQAIHIWTMQTQGNATRIKTEESLSGWLTRLLKLFDPQFLEKSLMSSLNVLKTRVES